MATNAICGHCGAALQHPSAACASCGARQYYPSLVRSHRNPALAALLAVVPGLGHLYVGDVRRGLGFFAAAGGLEFLGLDMDLTAVGAVVGVPMEVGGVGLWLFSIFDAYRSARRHNQGLG